VIIVMNPDASQASIDKVVAEIERMGGAAHLSRGKFRTVIGAVGEEDDINQNHLSGLDGVEKVVPIMKPYKLASREFHEEDTVIEVGGGSVPVVKVGGSHATCFAGPCAVENEQMLYKIAHHVRDAGATILRGGVYKPRTSPYSFPGLGLEGLRYLVEARERTGLPVITEVMEPGDVAVVADHADILQVGARNMQNFPLLTAVGRTGMPIMLKRGLAATIEEWLMSAEDILSTGNQQVLLCERGIRSFDTYTRTTFDLTAIPLLHHLTHLPVIADPSHATGKRWLVRPMALAAVAAGADGIMVEVHPHPEDAWSDGEQSLTLAQFQDLAPVLRQVHAQVRGFGTWREDQRAAAQTPADQPPGSVDH
jgi:3-deoxy-7-phosphoheptulonate synthase